MDLELRDKVVLITGGSDGIGLATAEAFLEEGSRVFIVGRRPDKLESALQSLCGRFPRASGAIADLRDEAEAERAVQTAETAFGSIDILVNCAGAARRVEPEGLDEQAWREGMDSKFFPYMNACNVILRRFRTRHVQAPSQPLRAAIVNVIGKGGKVPSDTHLPGGAANAALTLATAGLAQIYGAMGVRINALHPAAVVTQRLRRRYELAAMNGHQSIEDLIRDAAVKVPLGRFADPSEIANMVLFLASPRASYVTGANIMMDGAQRPVI